jgi:ABC-type dipeptide/oligopeptide/nickel transport system permease subunit
LVSALKLGTTTALRLERGVVANSILIAIGVLIGLIAGFQIGHYVNHHTVRRERVPFVGVYLHGR